MINKKIFVFMLTGVVLMAGVLTGCGGEYAGLSDRGAASGSAVSGDAVSGQAVSGSAIEEKKSPVSIAEKNRCNWFYSDTNFYYMSSGYGGEEFMERNLEDGTERKIQRKNLWRLCYVDKDWVYYVVQAGSRKEPDALYRAPIENNQVNVKKEECLFTDKRGIFSDVYCDGRYLLYVTEAGGYRKYDLRKKKDIGSFYKQEKYDDSAILAVVDGYVYLRLEEDGGLYRQKLDSEKVTRITKESVWGTAMAVWGEDVYYAEEYAMPFCIKKYHPEDGSTKVAVSEEQVEEMFRKNNLPDGPGPEPPQYIRYGDPDGMFVCGNRLYIQLEVTWDGQQGMYYKNIVFYLEQGKETELHYADELTECMLYESPSADDIDDMKVYYSRGRCVEITEEKCYLEIYDPQRDKDTLGCYDFKSGEFRYMTDEDMDWYLPYYVAPHFMMEKLWHDLPNYKDADWNYTDMYF